MIALLWQSGVIDHKKRIQRANDPVRLSRKLSLKRNSVPKAIGNEMVEAVVLAWSKPFRHRLDTLAVTGANEPGDIKRAHLSPLLVSELVQKRVQKCCKLRIPICHVAPPKKRAQIISNQPCPNLPK